MNKERFKKSTSEKIVEGMEVAYDKMLEFKKYKKTPVVVEVDGQVKKIDPELLIQKRKNAKENNTCL